MGHYVYRYIHPQYPWLYVGKTDNLDIRINTHKKCNTDNISREHLPLLNASKVQYIEVNSKVQSDYVEKMIIDKYKPFLNKQDKNGAKPCIEFTLPEWKDYGATETRKQKDVSERLKAFSSKAESIDKDFDYNRETVGNKGKVKPEEIYEFFHQNPDSSVKFVSIMYDEYLEPVVFKVTKKVARIIHHKAKVVYRCETNQRDWLVRAEGFEVAAGFYPTTWLAYEAILKIEQDKMQGLETSLNDLKMNINDVKPGLSFYVVDSDNAIIGNCHYTYSELTKDTLFSYELKNYGSGGCRTNIPEYEKRFQNDVYTVARDNSVKNVYEYNDRVLAFQPVAERIRHIRESIGLIKYDV